MGYKLIKGEFHQFYQATRHVGARPDGDSVWFKPNKPELLMDIGDDKPRDADFNKGGCVQLRFESIDALELHFKGPYHQNKEATIGARDSLLKEIGFERIEYAPNDEIPSSVRTATPHPRPGYILTRNIDPYGRPVSFVFAGTTTEKDGSPVWLNTNWLGKSLNVYLLKMGHVYPAYYTGLPADLRTFLTNIMKQAQKKKKGVWGVDTTNKKTAIPDLDKLSELALWPKFYRRLLAYFKDGNIDLINFLTWLRADPERDDTLWIISKGELGNIHDVIQIKDNKIRMTSPPDDLVIVPR